MLRWILDNSFLILYAITVGVAIWRYPKYFDTPLKFFPILLMYTFLNELFGSIIYSQDDISLVLGPLFYNNWIIFNIYNIVFFLYFYYIYWSYLKTGSHKKMVVIGALLFMTASFFNIFFQDFTYEPQLYAYITGGIVLIICIVLYALQLKQFTGNWFVPHNLICWLGLGMLVFYIGYVPIKILRQYNAAHELLEGPWVRSVHIALILIMYSCFIVGFVRMSRKSLS